MKRLIKTAALIAALAMMIGCSSNTTTEDSADKAALKQNPHGEQVLNTAAMGTLRLDLPGNAEVQSQELPKPENAEYDIESTTMYFYVVPKFRVRGTRVTYTDPASPDMETLSASIHTRIKNDPNVDYASKPEGMTVSGKQAVSFSIGYDEDAQLQQFGKAVVIMEAPGVYWLLDYQSVYAETMAVAIMNQSVESLAFAEETQSGENK